MTEDEQAELFSFTGKTIDGKQYVEFEDFDRLREWIRERNRRTEEIIERTREILIAAERARTQAAQALELDMQGGLV